MLRLRPPLSVRLFIRNRSTRPLKLFRTYTQQTLTEKPDPRPDDTLWHSELFRASNQSTLNTLKTVSKFSALVLFGVATTALVVYQGLHIYVETEGLSRETNEEVRRWEWNMESEKWSNGDVGGTDPALPSAARRAIRYAWMSQNWSASPSASAERSLLMAIRAAEKQIPTGLLRPNTIAELLTRRAALLEVISSDESALLESRSQYEHAWNFLPGRGIDAARIAMKLGNINQKLENSEAALMWWTRCIKLTTQIDPQKDTPDTSILLTLPQTPPDHPLAQRTLASALVALSAFYATSGRLRDARAAEEASLDLLKSMRPSHTAATVSPPQALHELYLIHRSALISIHLAEVAFALRDPITTSLHQLQYAASSSQRVALALSGLPTDSSVSSLENTSILKAYSASRSMKNPATNLLRDARCSAAEAWNLMGLLNEDKSVSNPEKAAECYARALAWSGVEFDKDGPRDDSGIDALEWERFWVNYLRAKEALKARDPPKPTQ